MSNSPIETILSRATQDLRELLEEAFEAGRAKEREDIRRQLAAYLGPGEAPSEVTPSGDTRELDNFTASQRVAPSILARAQPGTVKPAIEALIEKATNGISTSEIIEKTGFKENSIRGTLSALKADGFTERRGVLWFLSRKKSPLALASGL